MVITLACHARDRGFKSRRNRHCGFIAQLVEHKTENLGVVGSIPTEATIYYEPNGVFIEVVTIFYKIYRNTLYYN